VFFPASVSPLWTQTVCKCSIWTQERRNLLPCSSFRPRSRLLLVTALLRGCCKSPSPPRLSLRSQAQLKALLTRFQPPLLLPSCLPKKARTGRDRTHSSEHPSSAEPRVMLLAGLGDAVPSAPGGLHSPQIAAFPSWTFLSPAGIDGSLQVWIKPPWVGQSRSFSVSAPSLGGVNPACTTANHCPGPSTRCSGGSWAVRAKGCGGRGHPCVTWAGGDTDGVCDLVQARTTLVGQVWQWGSGWRLLCTGAQVHHEVRDEGTQQ